MKGLALLVAKAGGGELSTDPAQAHALARSGKNPGWIKVKTATWREANRNR